MEGLLRSTLRPLRRANVVRAARHVCPPLRSLCAVPSTARTPPMGHMDAAFGLRPRPQLLWGETLAVTLSTPQAVGTSKAWFFATQDDLDSSGMQMSSVKKKRKMKMNKHKRRKRRKLNRLKKRFK